MRAFTSAGMFQTLKGSLQTELRATDTRDTEPFQTLKGSLQTEFQGSVGYRVSRFQTLKGSLQTVLPGREDAPLFRISNPQRIATNSKKK